MQKSLPRTLLVTLLALIALGATAFLYGVTQPGAVRAWSIFLVNFLFWSGLAQALVVLAALMQLTKAQWAGPIRRLAEAGVAFLPLSFVLFLVIFFGREVLFPWILEPIEAKAAWLNVPFLFTRDGIGLLILYGLSVLFVKHSLRSATDSSHRVPAWIPPVLMIAYAFIMSLIAIDLAMSLDPHWYSNIYGLYYFVGNLYVALAALALATVLLRKQLGITEAITPARLHDLGKLLFGFCLFWMGMLWSHYLPIWYGNLPEETGYVITRIDVAPWSAMSWTVLAIGFVLPFSALLSRAVKRNPRALAAISALVVIALWLERYLLVTPSIFQVEPVSGLFTFIHHDRIIFSAMDFGWGVGFPFVGVYECLISLGFFAAAALCYLVFLHRFPPKGD